MSRFDDNLHEESTSENPFADPAIQEIMQNANTQLQVENYNPFDNQEQLQNWTTYGQSNTQPAVMQVTPNPVPVLKETYPTNSEHKKMLDTSDLERRQKELERKEEELTRLQEELRHNSYNVRHNNWPPFPPQCCFQPCFYQNIQIDIPVEFQNIVCGLYHLWIFHTIIMVLNVLAGIIVTDFTVIGMGILYVLLFTPFSYMCWFRPAYKAFRSDSSFNFMIFFFVFFFQFIVTTMQAIGLPNTGTIGLISSLNKFKSSNSNSGIATAVLELFIALGYSFAAAADLLLITKIHRIYRNTGASLAKAQTEFTTEFLNNQHLRNAASNIAVRASQSQVRSDGIYRSQ